VISQDGRITLIALKIYFGDTSYIPRNKWLTGPMILKKQNTIIYNNNLIKAAMHCAFIKTTCPTIKENKHSSLR